VVLCGASVVLVASHYQGATWYYRVFFGDHFDAHPASGALGHLWWFVTSVLLYFVVPLLLSVATRGSFHRLYGLRIGRWKTGLRLGGLFLLIMLPATYLGSRLEAFKGLYPLAGAAAYTLSQQGTSTTSIALFAIYEVGYLLYFVAWEFLFRGWILNAALRAWGRSAAILVPVAPFVVMHLGKAELEALGSIVAGIGLGILALRTRSFWYGALLHGIVAVWMDVLSVKDVLFKA
jgi:membrane protease YdiL (CAAX protease family)